MPSRCFMPPENPPTFFLRASQRLVCWSSACDELAPLACGRHALERREMVEHALGAQVRIEAELLRQVAEDLSDGVGLGEDVDVAEADVPVSGCCSVAMVRMSVDFPAPFGPSSPNMPARDRRARRR